MEDVIIRKVEYKDIESIVDINIKDWKKAYKGILDDDILENIDRKAKLSRWQKHYNVENVIIAEKDNNILGFCRYEEKEDYKKYKIDSEIVALYVDYETINHGIGKKLFKYAVKDLKAMNKTKMLIWVLEGNKNARKFYEKMGGKLFDNHCFYEYENRKFKLVGYVYDLNSIEI